jgi:hypothetical protein
VAATATTAGGKFELIQLTLVTVNPNLPYSCDQNKILSCVYGSVSNNNGFWIGLLHLLTPYFTITLNQDKFTITHNTPSAQF